MNFYATEDSGNMICTLLKEEDRKKENHILTFGANAEYPSSNETID